MRRMRDYSIGHYVAVAVPVLAAILGINHWVRHRHAGSSGKEVAAIKPSQFKQDDAKASRGVASNSAHHSSSASSASNDEADDRDDDADDREDIGRQAASDHKPSVTLAGAVNDALSAGTDCGQLEYRGDGPTSTKVTKGEWITVMDQFHAAKHDLLAWLEKRRHDLPEATALAMERQIRTLKIQRPPVSDEPDLAWRGIGVHTQNAEGEPIVKLGGGFVRLATKHPARARFEMARLVAQGWAPCELQRVSNTDATWSPLLKCLGVTELQSCGQGTYSEGGWAVSTTLAAAVSPPGCQIPAFKSPDGAKCLGNIPFAKMTAQNGASEGVARSIASIFENLSKGGRQ